MSQFCHQTGKHLTDYTSEFEMAPSVSVKFVQVVTSCVGLAVVLMGCKTQANQSCTCAEHAHYIQIQYTELSFTLNNN